LNGWAGPLSIAGILGSYFKPDVVMDIAGYGMGTFDGRQAAIGFLKDWISSLEHLTIEPDEIVELGNGVGLTVYRQEGRPNGSTNYERHVVRA